MPLVRFHYTWKTDWATLPGLEIADLLPAEKQAERLIPFLEGLSAHSIRSPPGRRCQRGDLRVAVWSGPERRMESAAVTCRGPAPSARACSLQKCISS
ncbi:hypothetical protein H920_06701 [Fukomys damarensis]|uniref:Uncharacterized protein n=1 Tax=Fukomys damarensis TaxID=885580 RepID=A0A091DNT0_FUKDA|nr:hypothetical protein H920_06701 [Fukomys damarensis]